jgi:hypothetical protein
MTSLYEITQQYRELERLDPSEDLPAEVIRDTLEALGGDLEVKATNVARIVLNIEAMADAVEAAAQAMKDRAARIRRRADSVREYLRTNMQGAGIKKIEAVEFTLALKKNPPTVIIDDAAQIPAVYMVTPEPPPPPEPRPDKKAIADALKAGADVPGAHIEQHERLDIRS